MHVPDSFQNEIHFQTFDLKANPVLIIDPNAVLSLPVSVEFLQTVCGRDTQILQASCM